MLPLCAKCGYQRLATDTHVHAGVCPRCGIVYSLAAAPQVVAAAEDEDTDVTPVERQGFLDWLTEPPERVDEVALYARAACGVGFAAWTLYFIANGIDWDTIGGSFLHSINLAFHEFGHVFFRPFGEFMTILGGSLFQVLWPCVLLLAFLFKYRDTFAAGLMLWWSGQNLVDLSPYIADAYYRGLPLVGGGGEESHDWGNLLTMTGLLDSHLGLARAAFFCGSVTMLVALGWMGRAWWRQRELQQSNSA